MKRIVIGNWKMNLTLAEAIVLGQSCARIAESHHNLTIVIAPSLPWLVPLHDVLRIKPSNFYIASQSVSREDDGAYTGDVSAHQLKGVVTYSLVGHSERRRFHHETGSAISDQVKQLLQNRITPVVCFGEMKQSPQANVSNQITVDLKHDLAGLTHDQVKECIFAYEPLWAIGTGNPATPVYAGKVINHVKTWSQEQYGEALSVLYGGSVTEKNAEALGITQSIDGLLVGGASLEAKRFKAICSVFHPHV
jgi:triosephosphate isomerase